MSNNKYTPQQVELIKEFAVYGIDENDIVFYSEKPDPFFTYEATALLLRKLTDVTTVDIEQKQRYTDTTVMICKLGFDGGGNVSAIGVVNHTDKINGEIMNEFQRFALASARAIRNAMRAGGINLLKAHNLMKQNGEITEQGADDLRNKLLAEAHLLGLDTGFILQVGNTKVKNGWYSIIYTRYRKNSSGDLSIEELTDFVAFLRSCVLACKKLHK